MPASKSANQRTAIALKKKEGDSPQRRKASFKLADGDRQEISIVLREYIDDERFLNQAIRDLESSISSVTPYIKTPAQGDQFRRQAKKKLGSIKKFASALQESLGFLSPGDLIELGLYGDRRQLALLSECLDSLQPMLQSKNGRPRSRPNVVTITVAEVLRHWRVPLTKQDGPFSEVLICVFRSLGLPENGVRKAVENDREWIKDLNAGRFDGHCDD